MEKSFTLEHRKRINEDIRAKYGKVAVSPKGNFKYSTGRTGLEGQNYDSQILKVLQEEVLASYCGVGNPFSLGAIKKGEAVVGVGCDTGVDTLVASIMAGPERRVMGIDLMSEMLDRARANLEKPLLGMSASRKAPPRICPFRKQASMS